MIVSLRHRLAFLCMPKCASTSVEAALAPFADISLGGPPGLKHLSYREYAQYIAPLVQLKRERMGATRPVETVCLVREPLDWMRSWFRYRSRPQLADPSHPFHQNYTGDLSFDAWIEAMISEDPPPSASTLGRQNAFVRGADGEVGVDRLFRYENLEQFAVWLSERLEQPLEIPRHNTSPRQPLTLGEDRKRRFRDHFREEYELYESVA